MARTKAAPRARFKFIDLFSGIGGTRLALEAAGGKCVFASEIDPNAVKTYFANFGDIPSGDVSAIDAKTIPPFDVLCAGFPCQPFSSIGKREGFMHATQGTMFHEILRIVQTRGPKVLLLENVSGLVTHDRGRTLHTIVSALEETGYRVQYRVLDAAFYGVPQRRNRIYIVAMRKDLFSEFFAFQWPTPTEKPKTLTGIIESGVVGYEISKHLQKSYIHKIKDGRPASYWHIRCRRPNRFTAAYGGRVQSTDGFSSRICHPGFQDTGLSAAWQFCRSSVSNPDSKGD